ncbi:MAG: hypothetical protein ACRCZI_00540, partial [Cetobacterium sp.]
METAELRGAIVGKEQPKNWLEGQDVAPLAFETEVELSLKEYIKTKAIKGKDQLVWLEGDDKVPRAFEMTTKMDFEDLEKTFGEKATVFLVNKNLQKMPSFLKGGLVWLKDQEVIGVVLRSKGISMVMTILHPHSKKGDTLVLEDLSQATGYYLQQLSGRSPLPFKHDPSLRSPLEHGNTLLDQCGYIKMSYEGPSVLLPPVQWRETAKVVIPNQPFYTLRTDKIKIPPIKMNCAESTITTDPAPIQQDCTNCEESEEGGDGCDNTGENSRRNRMRRNKRAEKRNEEKRNKRKGRSLKQKALKKLRRA